MTKSKTAICTPTATREEFGSILRELDGVGVKWESGESPSDIWCLDYYFSGCVISYKWDGEKSLMCGYFKSSREKQFPRDEFISAIKRDFGKELCKCVIVAGPDGIPYCQMCGGFPEDKPAISKMETTGDDPKIDCSYPTEIIEPCKHTFEMRHKGTEVYWACSKCGSHKEKPKMNYNKMTKAELINKLKFENACNDELRSNYGILKDENELHRVELGQLQGQNRKCFEQITALEKANAEQAETIENIRNRSISIEEVARMAQGERDNAKYALRIANAENTRIKRLAAQILCPDVLEGK